MKLYKLNFSPAARAAMMVLDIFQVPAEMIDVNILQGDHLKPHYLKKNPMHTVPVLEDGDLVIHDSSAILMYIAEKYGKDDTFYPKDVAKRTLVNQKLFFNSCILFDRLRNVTYPLLVEGLSVTDMQKNDIIEAFGFMEEFLSQSKYLAGDNITIADVAAVATMSSLVHIVPLDIAKYPKCNAWLLDISNQSYAKKCNAPGVKLIQDLIKSRMESLYENN